MFGLVAITEETLALSVFTLNLDQRSKGGANL
jgi:hypothetical protein